MTDTDTPADDRTADGPPTGDRAPLTRQTIVAAAMALADAEGVRALTMRKLAQSVGYEVMSLYNHVANKGELLEVMVDAVTATVETPPEATEPLAAVRSIALSLREALVRHPWAPELWLTQMPGPERSRLMEDLLRFLDRSDLTPELAHHGFHAVTNHVVGYTLQELGMAAIEDPEQTAASYIATLEPDGFPFTIAHVHQHMAGQTSPSFELVLDLILDGIVNLSRTS